MIFFVPQYNYNGIFIFFFVILLEKISFLKKKKKIISQ